MADDDSPNPSPDKDGNGTQNQSGLHTILEEVTGKKYADENIAKEAIKETFSYVGDIGGLVKDIQQKQGLNRTQAVEFIKGKLSQEPQKIDESKFVSKEEFTQATFFADNPQYKEYKDIVMTFKKANPEKSLDEIIKMDTFKTWFDNAQETSKRQKSILHSNPKIAVAGDKMQEARKDLKENPSQAGNKAVEAVIDAFQMRES